MSERPQTARSDVERFFQAIHQGKVRPINEYLDGGIDVNALDPQQQTPLIKAIYLSKEDVRSHVVRMLLRNGADVNKQDGQGKTALMHACAECGHDDVIRRIIATGKCDPNLQDSSGNCALGHAVRADNASAIRILVNSAHTKSEIDVSILNSEGDDPLSMALKLSHQECVKVLVEEGHVECPPGFSGMLQGSKADVRKKSSGGDPNRSSSKTSLKIDKISIHSKGSGMSLRDEGQITPVEVGNV